MSDANGEITAPFGDGAAPPDLVALWQAQERGDTDLLDAFELVLYEGIDDDDVLCGFTEADGVAPAASRALQRFVDEVHFVGEAAGVLVGYWVGGGGGATPSPLAEAPVVGFDGEGQFDLLARTLAEVLVAWTDPDDPEETAEVVGELRRLGITLVAATHDAVWARLEGVEEPSATVLRYQIEEQLSRGSS